MTPEEKMVWAAAYASSALAGDASPAARAHNVVKRLRAERVPDHGLPEWATSVEAMLEEMRGGK